MKVNIWELRKQNDMQKTVKDNVTFVDFTILNSDIILIISLIRIGSWSSLMDKELEKTIEYQFILKPPSSV